MTWTAASDSLPSEGEPVLLYLPGYAWPRPALATLRKGDPESEGEYHRHDAWLCAALLSLGGTIQRVQPEHLWARIPTPEGVDSWTAAPFTFAVEPVHEADVTPSQPAEAPLFEAMP